jgi:putative ABC transport system permease protein
VRFADVVGLALAALWQQKVRTFLTLLGVVIGSLVLMLSLSIGQGVREVIAEQFRRHDQLRLINVWPGFRPAEENIPAEEIEVKGDMSDERRDRLKQLRINRWQGKPKKDTSKRLTPERLEEVAALDHVAAVVPTVTWHGRIYFNNKMENADAASAEPGDSLYLQRLVAGVLLDPERSRGVVVSEYLLYQLGVRNEADVPGLLGQTLRFEFSSQPYRSHSLLWLLGGQAPRLTPGEEQVLDKIALQLPSAVSQFDLTDGEKSIVTRLLKQPRARPGNSLPTLFSEEYTIVGVIRVATREERRDRLGNFRGDADLLLPAATASELFFRVPGNRSFGVNNVVVRVDSEDNVKAVDERLAEMGLESYAPIKMLEQARFNVLMISLTTSFVALVALVVAALGIANTLLMSVLERTHEIGVMKAVGARDRHVQMMFLMEGALIGLLGSALGLLGGWAASFPLDNVARGLAEKQAKANLQQTLFVFPWWLVLGVLVFVTLLTMLAAVYPARRAARVNPMTALRHE